MFNTFAALFIPASLQLPAIQPTTSLVVVCCVAGGQLGRLLEAEYRGEVVRINISKQRRLDGFVRNEVIMLATQLVEDLLGVSMYGEKSLGGIDLDAIENLYIIDEATAKAWGYDSLEVMQEAGEDRREIYEWWFVTRWLYKRLRQKVEPVIESDYGYLWGRTCTGQAIFLDEVIEEIYDELCQ